MSGPATAPAPVAILGGGPIGLACALLLSMRGIRSHLIDARPLQQALQDRRLLALSRGTLQVLAGRLGERFAPTAPICEVHVSSSGEFGATRMRAGDFGAGPLGATVWYADLVNALASAAQSDPGITIRRPCRATGLEQRQDGVRVHLQDAQPLDAAVAINAEGTPAAAAPATRCAMLAELQAAGLASGTALERFTREGPLALLPMPDGPPVAGRKSMIWCVENALAQQLLALSEAEFVSKIQATLGPRIVQVTRADQRSAFALQPQRRERVREHRVVHIGNAAQSLHPVAGQGFNLGMRDCVCLADCLAQNFAQPLAALARYEAMRRADRFAIATFTTLLPDLFSWRLLPAAWARSLALSGIDLVPPLRRSLSSLLMFGVRN